eukprot:9482818-Pyramimonas_sp.AAC.1
MTATVGPRRLVQQCQAPSRKRQENLSRIARGLYPSYRGPPAAIRGAQAVSVASGLSVSVPPSGREASSAPVELDEYP